MAAFTLAVNPTFKAKVGIPVAGGTAVDVEFAFKHRTRAEMETWLNGGTERENVQAVLDMCEGWELEDEFNRDSVFKLCENYIGATRAILDVYIAELTASKAKN